MSPSAQEQKQLAATRRILNHLAETLDIPLSVQLWDGSSVSLGKNK